MLSYVPADLPPGAPLVVILHGCTQTAAAYDHGTGWSVLADRLGFALLLPEPQRVNNPNSCFTWFAREDSERGRGEPLSIRRMIERMIVDHGLDRRRVYISGLSAGGAMTSGALGHARGLSRAVRRRRHPGRPALPVCGGPSADAALHGQGAEPP